jgi:hypothetical protein
MSFFGRVRPCKHGDLVQNCVICRTKTKPLSKRSIHEVKRMLTGNLRPIGGTRCLCHQKREPVTREQAQKRLRKEMVVMAKATVTG